MKNRHLLIVIVITLFSCERAPKGTFILKGNVKELNGGKATLKKDQGRRFKNVATVDIVDGKFQFSDSIVNPGLYALTFDSTAKKIELFLEQGFVKVSFNAKVNMKPKISGSKSQKTYERYLSEISGVRAKIKIVTKEYMEANKSFELDKAKIAEKKYLKMVAERKDKTVNFIKNNGNSYVSAYLALQINRNTDYNDLKIISESLSADILRSDQLSWLPKRLKIEERVAPGKVAPKIVLNDMNGEEFDLASLKGKYVLLDFWASWCGPCRELIPELKKFYAKHKDNNFEVVAISTDRRKKDWIMALNEEDTNWINLHQSKRGAKSPSKIYGVRAIPHTVIISPEGKIVATRLHGDELFDKLEELIGAGV